jgi:hypothetical protein
MVHDDFGYSSPGFLAVMEMASVGRFRKHIDALRNYKESDIAW